jgi:glutamate racemase
VHNCVELGRWIEKVIAMRGQAGAVAIFDSGVGGLSVMNEVARVLPQEDILYFADTVHCPYGRRTHGEIQRLAQGIVAFLLSRGGKVIVVACNTASAAALRDLRETWRVPIVGMEPAVKPATERTNSRVVGVIATEVTFQGELFASLIERFATDIEVLTQTCPGLVDRVEAGLVAETGTKEMLRGYLRPMLDAGIDSLVLGCTHYPFLKPLIREIIGDEVQIIDPAPAVAWQTRRVLERGGLLSARGPGRYTFYTTADPERFGRVVEKLTPLKGPVLGATWSGGEIIAASG